MVYAKCINALGFTWLLRANDEFLLSLSTTTLCSIRAKENEIIAKTAKELDNYFQNKAHDFSEIPLDLSNFSSFHRQIYEKICLLQPGISASYKDLANELGLKAYQAISAALNENPYQIILPSHRIVRQDATIGRKNSQIKGLQKVLLEHEWKVSGKRLIVQKNNHFL